MLKSLANRNGARLPRLALLLVVVALSGGLIIANAQQPPQSNQQQRPRRVGTKAQQTPTPTPGTSSTPTPVGEEVGEGDVVRVDTQLVSVPAVVTDRTGRPLPNLRAENFVVYEDGRPQQISNFATTEAPFEVVLLLDTSGSTRADLGLIRRAARAFIDALRPGDRVSIVGFNSSQDGASGLATVDLLTRLTDDREALQKALENIGASNGTPYYDALTRIAGEVFREPPREEVRGRRAVVALTDGVDSASDADYEEARARLQRVGVACYFIQVNTEDFVEDRLLSDCQQFGTLRLSKTQLQRYRRIFVPRADATSYEDFCQMGQFERMTISRSLYDLARREMNELARASGGKTFPVADLSDARAAFAQVAHEIGTQYSLGYYPTNKTRDGHFRSIRVEVRGVAGAGAQVRAREGYYAPKS
ncbi:MAG TPA: VWA domain-containing protein [Pyrinomonadaceae bacterium]|jgi:VWFA-related protein|nr:VWA domain-containing protein [Pyrinomonadaceae bacterium]